MLFSVRKMTLFCCRKYFHEVVFIWRIIRGNTSSNFLSCFTSSRKCMQQSELMLLVFNSTIGKSCAAWESLCKQRVYEKRPRYFLGTVLDCCQNVMEDVGNKPSTSMHKHCCVHSVCLTKDTTSWRGHVAVLGIPGYQCWKLLILVHHDGICGLGMCNSFQNRNYLPLVWNRECHSAWTGPLLLPRVSPGEVLLVQLFTLQLNWENSE